MARGALAQLESGIGNPTVETLYALADALGVPLADLLAAEPPAEPVRVVRAARARRSAAPRSTPSCSSASSAPA